MSAQQQKLKLSYPAGFCAAAWFAMLHCALGGVEAWHSSGCASSLKQQQGVRTLGTSLQLQRGSVTTAKPPHAQRPTFLVTYPSPDPRV
jgi:hypothetical protein